MSVVHLVFDQTKLYTFIKFFFNLGNHDCTVYDVIIGSSFYETVQVNITLTIPYRGYILLGLNFALFITKQVLGE